MGSNKRVEVFVVMFLIALASLGLVIAGHTTSPSAKFDFQNTSGFLNVSFNGTITTSGYWGNTTHVNITLPASWTYTLGTANTSLGVNIAFSNTSVGGVQVLNWVNTSEAGLVGNVSNATFWFNYTVSDYLFGNSTFGTNYIVNVTSGNGTSQAAGSVLASTLINVSVVDNIIPGVIGLAPIGNYNISTNVTELNVSVVDNTFFNTSICSVSLNYTNDTGDNQRTPNQTMLLNGSRTGANFTTNLLFSLNDTSYTALFTCNDTSNNVNGSVRTVFRIDRAAPNASFNGLAKSITSIIAYGNYSGATQMINVSVNDTGVVNVSVFFNISNATFSNLTLDASRGFASYHGNSSYWNTTFRTTGYADGIYNITIYANDSLNNINRTTFIQVRIDNTVPNVSVLSAGNTTIAFGNYSGNVLLNSTIFDYGSNISAVYYNISNGTFSNFTIASQDQNALNFWNTTLITSAYPTGNWNITVYANDTTNTGNVNATQRIQVTLDNTAPIINLTLPTNGSIGTTSGTSSDDISFNYIVNDFSSSNCTLALDGVIISFNSSVLGTELTNTFINRSIGLGTHNWAVNCTDSAGNTGNRSSTFVINKVAAATSSSSGGGGGSAAPSFWSNTFVENDKPLAEKGEISENIKAKERVSINVGGSTHHVGVVAIENGKAVINVSSTPQTATLGPGESGKFELNGDKYYDVKVTVVSIVNGVANVSIVSINESVQEMTTPSGENKTISPVVDAAPIVEEVESGRMSKMWWAIIVVLIAVIAIVIYLKKRK